MHTYYMFSLNSFIYFFLRGISTAGIIQEEVAKEGEEIDPMDEASVNEGSLDGGSSVGNESSVAGKFCTVCNSYIFISMICFGTAEVIPDLDVLDEQIARRVSEIEARDKAEQGSNLPERLKVLKQNVTLVIVDFVRTGLFEKDKLTVVTLVTLNIMCDEGLLQREYVDIITRGRVAEEVAPRGQGKHTCIRFSCTQCH